VTTGGRSPDVTTEDLVSILDYAQLMNIKEGEIGADIEKVVDKGI
jgi:hypothetical protein